MVIICAMASLLAQALAWSFSENGGDACAPVDSFSIGIRAWYSPALVATLMIVYYSGILILVNEHLYNHRGMYLLFIFSRVGLVAGWIGIMKCMKTNYLKIFWNFMFSVIFMLCFCFWGGIPAMYDSVQTIWPGAFANALLDTPGIREDWAACCHDESENTTNTTTDLHACPWCPSFQTNETAAGFLQPAVLAVCVNRGFVNVSTLDEALECFCDGGDVGRFALLVEQYQRRVYLPYFIAHMVLASIPVLTMVVAAVAAVIVLGTDCQQPKKKKEKEKKSKKHLSGHTEPGALLAYVCGIGARVTIFSPNVGGCNKKTIPKQLKVTNTRLWADGEWVISKELKHGRPCWERKGRKELIMWTGLEWGLYDGRGVLMAWASGSTNVPPASGWKALASFPTPPHVEGGVEGGGPSVSRCGTVVSVLDGLCHVRLDNSDTVVQMHLTPTNTRPEATQHHKDGTRLMLLTSATGPTWVDGTVEAPPGPEDGTRHHIRLEHKGVRRVVQIDLNSFNHVKQELQSSEEYLHVREKYRQNLFLNHASVTDAITGKKLHVSQQTAYIKLRLSEGSGQESWKMCSQSEAGPGDGGKIRWSKPGTRVSWLAAKAHAEELGGRLLTLSEARALINDKPRYPDSEQWVPVTSDDGTNRDWMQVGLCARHYAGKSHVVDCGFYPPWGDGDDESVDHSGVNCVLLWKAYWEIADPKIQIPANSSRVCRLVANAGSAELVLLHDQPKDDGEWIYYEVAVKENAADNVVKLHTDGEFFWMEASTTNQPVLDVTLCLYEEGNTVRHKHGCTQHFYGVYGVIIVLIFSVARHLRVVQTWRLSPFSISTFPPHPYPAPSARSILNGRLAVCVAKSSSYSITHGTLNP